jgi:cyclic lactone autoinducer peptide
MKKFYKVLSALLSVVAIIAASSASFILYYQPRTPKCLK